MPKIFYLPKQIIKEYTTSHNFNYDDLTQLKSFAKRVEYCRNYLPFRGSGSSRIVFQLPNGHALKLARNAKGIAQNEQEHYNDQYAHDLGIVPIVFAGADDETWIEVELASKVLSKDFNYLLGISMNDFFDFLRSSSYFRGSHWKWFPPFSEEKYLTLLEGHPELKEWDEYIANSDPFIGDMLRKSQYGKLTRNGEEYLVLVDYGITDEAYNKYYLPK